MTTFRKYYGNLDETSFLRIFSRKNGGFRRLSEGVIFIAKKKRMNRGAPKREEVLEGYRKLAFGAGNDALKLLFFDEQPCWEELADLDVFNISEINRPKGGGMVIKFYDRFEAMQHLVDIGGLAQVPDGVRTFYEAIERSVGQ